MDTTPANTPEYPPRPTTLVITRPPGVKLGIEYWQEGQRYPGSVFPFPGTVRLAVADGPPGRPIEVDTRPPDPDVPSGRGQDLYEVFRQGLVRLSAQCRDRADTAPEGEKRLLVEFEAVFGEIARTFYAIMPRSIETPGTEPVRHRKRRR